MIPPHSIQFSNVRPSTKSVIPPSPYPIFERQALYTFELAGVARDQGEGAGERLPCDEYVIGADGGSFGRQRGADFSRPFGVGLGERQHLEFQGVDHSQVFFHLLAIICAEAEFVMRDGGDAEVGSPVGAKAVDELLVSPEHFNQGVRVEQESHSKKSSSGRDCSPGLSAAAFRKSSSTGRLMASSHDQSPDKRFEDDGVAFFPDSNLIALEPELLRKANGLRAT